MFEFDVKEVVAVKTVFMIAYERTLGVVQVVYGYFNSPPSVGDSFPRGVLTPDGEWRVTSVFGEDDQVKMADLFHHLDQNQLMEVMQVFRCSV
jgi:hypothetical protein